MGKNTDKSYITHSEWSSEFGGARSSQSTSGKYRKLPFDCCMLSMQPLVDPMATAQGHVFERANILKWLQERGDINPISGSPLTASELISIHLHKNTKGEWHCPLSFRLFGDNIHLVYIRTSGNVFAWEAVDKLNVQAKHWRDLLTDEPFKRADIITIQDPMRPELRDSSEFWYVKNELKPVKREDDLKVNLPANTMAGRILKELAKSEKPATALPGVKYKDVELRPAGEKKPYNAAVYSTGRVAASFTSTFVSPITVNQEALVDDQEFMFAKIKKKAYAQIKTNYGDINLELYSNVTPRTCFNFLSLSKKGYYQNTIFHRNIKNFMIQGGDPTGTGSGGESIWGKQFGDEFRSQYSHSERGVLSMANKGRGTNGSQFFITYRACKHLDNKHTIFGKVIGGLDVLDKLEQISVDATDRPLDTILITDILVLVDPFEEYQKQLEKSTSTRDVTAKKRTEEDELKAITTVGKYMGKEDATMVKAADMPLDKQKHKRVKRGHDMSDFSSW